MLMDWLSRHALEVTLLLQDKSLGRAFPPGKKFQQQNTEPYGDVLTMEDLHVYDVPPGQGKKRHNIRIFCFEQRQEVLFSERLSIRFLEVSSDACRERSFVFSFRHASP